MPYICTSNYCKNTKELVRIPEDEAIRRAHLNVLWAHHKYGGNHGPLEPPDPEKVDKAINNKSNLRVCRDHYEIDATHDSMGNPKRLDWGKLPLPWTHKEKPERYLRKQQQISDRIQSARSERGMCPMTELKCTLEQSEINRVNLLKQYEQLKSEHEQLNSRLNDANAKIDTLAAELAQIDSELADLKLNSVPRLSMNWVLEGKYSKRIKDMTGFACFELLMWFISQCYIHNLHTVYDSNASEVPPFVLDFMNSLNTEMYKDQMEQADEPQDVEMEDVIFPIPQSKAHRGSRPKLSFIDALCMTLFQYRQSLTFSLLAHLFGVSETTANGQFKNISNLLHTMLVDNQDGFARTWSHTFNKENFETTWNEEKIRSFANNPKFKSCVLIIDCTEIFTQTPSSSILKKLFFSNYKHHQTVKLLVIMDVRGNIVYVSPPFPGHISDVQITSQHESIFQRLWNGAGVMVDKGFTQLSVLAKRYNLDVIIPPRLNIRDKFSKQQLSDCQEIAATRIHVERAIRRAKTFKYLDREVSVSELPNYGIGSTVCFYISSFISPLVLDVGVGEKNSTVTRVDDILENDTNTEIYVTQEAILV